jgi:16S rRNA (guanine966-N2)-methyltransferase
VRIIAGKFKNQLLVDFKADHIRPTTDRVKESLFNIMMGHFDGSRVLDLFAGTGNLGIEALSRGAREVVFVESNPKSVAIIKQNIAKFKIQNDCQIVIKDVPAFLKSYVGEPFDVIIADPPFTEKMAHDVMVAMAQGRSFNESTIISIESQKKERIDEDYGTLIRYDQRFFGDKTLSFFKAKES